MALARYLASRLRWQAVAVAVAAGLVLLACVSPFRPVVGRFGQYWQDVLLRNFPGKPFPEKFTLLAIDNASLAPAVEPEEAAGSRALQLMEQTFPWSREVYAELVDRLVAAGARLIIFDLAFHNPGPDDSGDAAFAGAIRRANGRVVLATPIGLPTSGHAVALPPLRLLREASGGQSGIVSLPKDDDDVVRSMFLGVTASDIGGEVPLMGEEVFPSLAAVAARALDGAALPTASQHQRLRFSRPGTLDVRSIYEIFVPEIWRLNYGSGTYFKDRVVMIGATAETMQDFHPTAVGRLSGPEIHFHALAALLRGDRLTVVPHWLDYVLVGLAALAVFGLAVLCRAPGVMVLGLAGLVGVIAVAAVGALAIFSVLVPVGPPVLGVLVCGFASVVCDVSSERRERNRLRGTLERYVSKDIVREIVENPETYLDALGGDRRDVVVLFSDLKGFTADAERMDPADMVRRLNEYFGEMVEVVFAHGGTIDKFMGDALMATWGVLRTTPAGDSARLALTAAFAMRGRLAAINEGRRARGEPEWASGTGLARGPAVFGNIGSQAKMDLTVIGDTVNLASRLEGLTRVYGCDILINEVLAESVAAWCHVLLVDIVRVKGRQTPEKIFHPLAGAAPGGWEVAFRAAGARYQGGDFAGAAQGFSELEREAFLPALARRFRLRCEHFLVQPPPANWSGVWDFAEK